MSLPNGRIKCNCPACLEPDVLVLRSLGSWTNDGIAVRTSIRCTNCAFRCVVPAGPNPHQEVALEIIGANEFGECQAGDRRLIVHEGEAMDVIPGGDS